MNGVTQITARSGSVSRRVSVTVMAPLPNRPPEPVGQIAPLMLTEGGPTVEVDVSGAFRDPDGDELKFAAESSDEQVATAEVVGSKANIRPVAAGEATVTVTASDGSLTAEQRFIVTVRQIVSQGADLVVEAPTVSGDQLSVGDQFTLSATVNNQGDGDAEFPTRLRFFRSADESISTADEAVGIPQVLSRLSASETSEESISLSAPDTPGTYFYGACVDPVTAESDTQNNCSSAVSVTVGPETVLSPDLVVEAPTVSGDQLSVGDRFTLSATVNNQGDGDARSSTTLRFYRSSDATISTDDTEVGTDHVFSLDASESSEESISLSAPDTPGTYFYGACVDPVTGEADTQNNCSIAVSVTVGPETILAPDLVVEAPTVSGDQLSVGDRFTLSATVNNQGDGDAEFPTRLRFFRSADESISTADEAVGIPQVVSRLSASETSEESISLSAPDTPGTYYYGACVDPVTGETDTENNCSDAVSVTVAQDENRPPVARGMIPGQSVPVGETVKVNASSYFNDPDDDPLTYRASSSEPSVAAATIETAEVIVRGESNGSAVITITASDGSLTATQTFNVTVGNPAGQGPDLIVESLIASKDALDEGEWFTLSAIVRNQGDGDMQFPSILSFYLSSDDSISSTDFRVGIDQVTSLNPSESSEVSIDIPAPVEKGTYYYYACVGHVFGESNTENNCSALDEVAVGFTPGAPDAPAMARIRREGQKNTVSWTPAPSASHYNLYNSRIPVELHASELVSNIKGTSYEQIDTSDLFEYYYWIQACNDLGCSELYWVGPPVRQGIVVIDRDEVSLTIRLFSSGFSTHYALFRSDMADVGFSEVDERIESTEEAVTYIDEGLMDDSTYFYRARSCNANGCSAFTHVAGGITEAIGPVDVPPPPEGVVAEEVDIPLGPNDGRVRWSATPRATYYEIFEDGQYEATVSAPRTSYYDSSPNTFFGSLIFTGYTVHACNKSGCGPGVSVCISCY